MIRVTGRLICVSHEDAAIVAARLPAHIRLSSDEPGCLTFSVTPSASPLIWDLDESFVDRAAFEAHQARTRESDWFLATAHLTRDFKVDERP